MRKLGKAAGDAAIALCANKDVKAVKDTAEFTTPGGNKVSSILLAPLPVLQDNLNAVLSVLHVASIDCGMDAAWRIPP